VDIYRSGPGRRPKESSGKWRGTALLKITANWRSAEFDFHEEDGSGEGKRHGVCDDDWPGMNKDSVDQPQAYARAEHQIHAQTDVFGTAMLQRSHDLCKIRDSG